MKKNNLRILKQSNLINLSYNEKLNTTGGDKFLYDLGVLAGRCYNWLITGKPIGAPTMNGHS